MAMDDSKTEKTLALLGSREGALFPDSGLIQLPSSCPCSMDGPTDSIAKSLPPAPPVLQRSPRSAPNLNCRDGCPSLEVITAEDLSKPMDIQQPAATQISTPSLKSIRSTICGDPSRLIEVVSQEDLSNLSANLHQTDTNKTGATPKSPGGHDGNKPHPLDKVAMVYNEYGELVAESSLKKHPTPDELSVTQLLRVINKRFHHELRAKFSKIFLLRPDTKSVMNDGIRTSSLTSWDIRPASATMEGGFTPEEIEKVASYDGPTRVLEIGCSDGSWCFSFKNDQPTWIVEGIDDTDHWSCVEKDLVVRSVAPRSDFMLPQVIKHVDDYFGRVPSTQTSPEFTVRDLNTLLHHQNPICHNLYSFVRAREIFDRVENYKMFCDSIRLILKPGGIVEFLEVDPRPHLFSYEVKRDNSTKTVEHKSGPTTDWTDNIPDRLNSPADEGLARNLPGWQKRVAERLKATLRPRDGIPAVNLKSWLEGAGFSDVKEIIQPIPVGGNTQLGQFLKDFVVYQSELEDSIPKLRDEIPAIEMEAVESGAYCLNLHIVTCVKPSLPRPGDLLKDGARQDMTSSKYEIMGHYHGKDETWKRFDLEGQLSGLMKNLTGRTGRSGAPESRSGTQEDAQEGKRGVSLFNLLASKTDREGRYDVPPLLTVKVPQINKTISGIVLGDEIQASRTG